MSEVLEWQCRTCKEVLQVTTENFYKSDIRKGVHLCKNCRAKRSSDLEQFLRNQIRANAKEANVGECYQSVASIAKTIGWTHERVWRHLLKNNIPFFNRTGGQGGRAVVLRQEDAEILIANRANGHESITEPVPIDDATISDSDNEISETPYLTIAQVACMIGIDKETVRKAIKKGKLKASQEPHENGSGFTYRITREDAEAYIALQSNGHKPISEGEESLSLDDPLLVAPTHCDACDTTKGNIIGDVDEIVRERKGFLCTKCFRIVKAIGQEFRRDPQRIGDVTTYLRRIYK